MKTMTPATTTAVALEYIGRLSRHVTTTTEYEVTVESTDYRPRIAQMIRERAKTFELEMGHEMPIEPVLHACMHSSRTWAALDAYTTWRDIVLARPVSWWSLALQIESLCGFSPDAQTAALTPCSDETTAYFLLSSIWSKRTSPMPQTQGPWPWPDPARAIIASIAAGCHVITPVHLDRSTWTNKRMGYLSRTTRAARRMEAWSQRSGIDTIPYYEITLRAPERKGLQ